MNSFAISCPWLGLFPVQLTCLALNTFNTEEATVNYLTKDAEAAVIALLENS
jgi:hypothetical protein